jgi:hypothetical protein
MPGCEEDAPVPNRDARQGPQSVRQSARCEAEKDSKAKQKGMSSGDRTGAIYPLIAFVMRFVREPAGEGGLAEDVCLRRNVLDALEETLLDVFSTLRRDEKLQCEHQCKRQHKQNGDPPEKNPARSK